MARIRTLTVINIVVSGISRNVIYEHSNQLHSHPFPFLSLFASVLFDPFFVRYLEVRPGRLSLLDESTHTYH